MIARLSYYTPLYSTTRRTDAVRFFSFVFQFVRIYTYRLFLIRSSSAKEEFHETLLCDYPIIAWCDRQLRRLTSLQAASDLRNNYSQLKSSWQRPKTRCLNFNTNFLDAKEDAYEFGSETFTI